MASYFDLPPARTKAAAAPTAGLKVPASSGLGKMSLMSPAVSSILDELELEGESSSDDDKASLSGDENITDKGAKKVDEAPPNKPHREQSARKVQTHTSPLAQPSKKDHKAAPPRPSKKHPHLERFQSLRSMIFRDNIEANMHKATAAGECKVPESQWKEEHEKRQGLNRPKTPEGPPKQGIAHRLGNSLRRMTTKDVPTMNSIKEAPANDNESTASDEEDERAKAAEDSDASEEIDHSDIEDIVRWASRRDPPSDGERGRARTTVGEHGKEDSGHESFGDSDVDDLVRWASRNVKPESKTSAVAPKTTAAATTKEEHDIDTGSDVSTQSDSSGTSDEEDMDDLVRWVSRREGPNAGPIREKKTATTSGPSSVKSDSHEDEVDRWKSREHDMSGESDVDELTPQTSEEPSLAMRPKQTGGSALKTEVVAPASPARESNAGLADDDVDELVSWLSRKKSAQN
jgi:hypothetical protein